MKEQIINQIVVPVLVMIIGTILEVARRQLKIYLDSKQELIDKQKEALQQSMGIEQYNKDVSTVKQTVLAVEQLGREFNWEGAIKHSKVLEKLKGKTGLTDAEIYDIIKAVVADLNKDRGKTIAGETNEVVATLKDNCTVK